MTFSKVLARLFLGTCCLLPASAFVQPVAAASSGSSGGQIDVNFFYDNLKDQGSWFNTTEYGDVWQPYIAYKSDSWRPYTDGYWTYTDGGWMFVSNEDFGWAVYHYGRWTHLQDIGWAWVPGTEWAPAWVTWRESKSDDTPDAPDNAQVAATTTDATNPTAPPPPEAAAPASGAAPAAAENYIGWAPLPPEPVGYVASDPYYSYGPAVDVDYGIDPYDYSFVTVGAFGSPWLAGVIFDRDRGYYACERSVNVTNVYYNRDGRGYRGYYNGGPNYDRLRGRTERPIGRYNLARNTNPALVRRQIRDNQFNRISGKQINVAAPRFSQRNVRNGRVNFARRGAIPVTPVGRQTPATAADNPAYQRAQASFKRQGEAYRTAHPNARGEGPRAAGASRPAEPGLPGERAGVNGTAERIATTPLARQEERQARAAAEREGRPEGDRPPNGREPAVGANQRQNESTSVGREPGRQARAEQRRVTRQNVARAGRASAAPRREGGSGRRQAAEARARAGGAPRRATVRAGGPGGGRAHFGGNGGARPRVGGGGGGRARAGGGGGRARAGGGGGHPGGGEGKKR